MAITSVPPIRTPRTGSVTRQKGIIPSRQTRLAVIGLGYVGLPLAVAFAKAGFHVVGIDIDSSRVGALEHGSPIADVSTADLLEVKASGHLRVEDSYDGLQAADTVFLCVPTPCTPNKQPDTSSIAAAARGVSQHIR